MPVRLMTGNTSVPVPSASDGALYAGIVGPDSYVQKIGKMCAASLDGPNKLVVQSGSIVHNGRHILMEGNTEFTIPSGLQAQKRSNLCVIRYKSEPDGGEDVECLVLTGEAVTDGEPPDPPLNEDSILDKATVSDMVLYRVVTDGINALEPVPLFDVMMPMSELRDSLSRARPKGGYQLVPVRSEFRITFDVPFPEGLTYAAVAMVNPGTGDHSYMTARSIQVVEADNEGITVRALSSSSSVQQFSIRWIAIAF